MSLANQIVIRLRDEHEPDGKPLTIDAYVFGLWAAHVERMGERALVGEKWVVTHIPTGRYVPGFRGSKRSAMSAARRLGDLVNTKSIRAIKQHGRLIRQICLEEGL